MKNYDQSVEKIIIQIGLIFLTILVECYLFVVPDQEKLMFY